MLTLDRENKSALHYDDLNSSIKDTFATIDQFELQAVEQIRLMDDERMYKIAGYKNFEQYCQGELHVYGGYRRINQLLGASKVIVAAGELGSQIKNERQARPLLRLAKEPEKLIAAITLALSSNPNPSESDFAAARAEAQVNEQIQSLQNLYKQQKEQNIQLQQRLDEMESLRQLSTENQQLKERIRDLENAFEPHQLQDWGNTYTKQGAKALNKKVQQALEKTIDLRTLAAEPLKENATECLRLMGMALKNLSIAMNNTQALEAAAIILGTSPTHEAIATRTEQLQLLPQAVREIRQVLARIEFTWQEFWAVAEKYEVIKPDYWAELTTQETDLITQARKDSEQLTVNT